MTAESFLVSAGLEQLHAVKRAVHQGVALVLSRKSGVERAAVDAYADGNPLSRHSARKFLQFLAVVHIAGVHSYFFCAVVYCQMRKAATVMYVGYERKARAPRDFAERRRRLLVRYGKPHEVAPRFGEFRRLPDAAFDIDGSGIQHRLHRDGRSPAYRHIAHTNPSRKTPFDRVCRAHFFLAFSLYSSAFFFISAACGRACEE